MSNRSNASAVDWAYVDSNMGKVSDRSIAGSVGVSVNTIRRYREKKGVSPFCVEATSLPERFVQMLGTMPDQQIADLSSIPVKTVSAERRKRGIEKAYASRHDTPNATPPAGGSFKWCAKTRKLLGQYSDNAVGKLLGLSKTPVRAERERMKIPAFRQGATMRWTQKRIERLGLQSDPTLAHEWGVSVTRVRNKRLSLEIPAFESGHHATK